MVDGADRERGDAVHCVIGKGIFRNGDAPFFQRRNFGPSLSAPGLSLRKLSRKRAVFGRPETACSSPCRRLKIGIRTRFLGRFCAKPISCIHCEIERPPTICRSCGRNTPQCCVRSGSSSPGERRLFRLAWSGRPGSERGTAGQIFLGRRPATQYM